MDPNYMDSFFPFPPIENDGLPPHSGGSGVAPLPSPGIGYYGQGHGQPLPPQQPGQPGQQWW
jgi:hypothetical protein